jgi:hypothetical protein
MKEIEDLLGGEIKYDFEKTASSYISALVGFHLTSRFYCEKIYKYTYI